MMMTATGADSSATVAVPANADWTSTGMTVHKGQWLDISADGEVSVEPGAPTGPDGDSGRRQGAHPVTQGVGLGALLGGSAMARHSRWDTIWLRRHPPTASSGSVSTTWIVRTTPGNTSSTYRRLDALVDHVRAEVCLLR